ncbi:MAG: amino acid adenylation domain-containing protein [Pirellulales bacterium]|nr:amino acid adenylation domain-containing protein [Pirellulales bacterium]
MPQALAARLAQLSPEKQALFEQLRRGQRTVTAAGSADSRDATSCWAPLSFAQERLWYLDQLTPGNPFYNVATAVRLRGQLDFQALQAALQATVDRHAGLRTTFALVEGEPRQIVGPVELPLAQLDLRDVPVDQREARLRSIAQEEALRSFDLARGPLLRAQLVRTRDDEHTLLLTLHHIVCDGWSLAVLQDDVAEYYAAHVAGRSPDLAPLALEYLDYTRRQRHELPGARLDALLRYWSRELSDLPGPLELPTDHPRPAAQTFRGDVCRLMLDRELSGELRVLAGAERATPYMLLLAAWQLLLGRWSRRHDVAVGTPIAQRHHRDLERLVGFFVNTLVLRGRFEDDPSFREFLDRVKQSTLGALTHQELPFARLVEHLQPPRDASRPPLVQVMFVMQNIPVRARQTAGLTIEETSYDHAPVSHFDLTLNVDERHDGFQLSLVFNPDLYERETIERLLASYETLLRSIVAEPARRVSQLALAPAADLRRQLVERNRTSRSFPHDRMIHELIAERAAADPTAIALVLEDRQVTYHELDAAGNRLARLLAAHGVTTGTPVGISLDRSVELIVAMLAVLKAGGVYVPLDPAYPPQRRAYMITDAGLALVLTRADLAAGIQTLGCQLLLLDAEQRTIDSMSAQPLERRCAPRDLAYIIYTSGSTGEPKGVEVEHRGLVNHAVAFAAQCELGPGDRLLQYLSPSFDAAAEEIFPTLASGATLVLHPAPAELAGRSLLEWSRAAGVNVLHLPVAVWNSLFDAEHEATLFDHLRLVIAGGDNVSRDALRRWREMTRDRVRFLFAYGVTEATITSTLFDGREEPAPSGSPRIPIGRALANHRVYILDERLQCVPTGVAGEIALGGVGVARGYRGRPTLTAGKFVADSFGLEPDDRIYRTGDLGRVLADGSIEFLGRIDQQVKIRGYRIEPGEIEAALLRHQDVHEAIVVPLGDGESRRLAAYVGSPGDRPPTEADLREFLADMLPSHMLPTAITVLAHLPRLPGAKVDVASLPDPNWNRATRSDAGVAPRDELEAQLAAIWRDVLGIERVGVHDNFFELGGDSIRTIQVVARAGAQGLRLTPKQCLERQTIAELAPVVGLAPAVLAEQGPVVGPVPLLPIQHEFFSLELADAQHFNQSVLLEVDPALSSEVLATALRLLGEHHDALRMRYERQPDGSWRQRGLPTEAAPMLERVESTAIDVTEIVAAVDAAAAAIQAGLDLARGPIARFVYFDRGASQSARLLIVVHHLAIDAVSWRIVLEDLNLLCGQLQRGQAPVLPPKTTSYRDWSDRLREYAASHEIAEEAASWLSTAAENRRLPCESSERTNTVESSATVRVALDADMTQALLTDAQLAYRTRPQDLLLAALAHVLTDFTGDHAVRLHLEGHGRETAAEDLDLSRTVGWFTALYPVVLRLPATNSPGDLIRETKEQLRQIRNGGLGYGLWRWLSHDDTVRATLAAAQRPEICFNYLGQFDHLVADEALLRPVDEPHGADHGPRNERAHLWEINAYVHQGALQIAWTYGTGHHRRETIERLAAAYLDQLRELIEHCLAPGAGGVTPSDFPLADLDQDDLDTIAALLERDEPESDRS